MKMGNKLEIVDVIVHAHYSTVSPCVVTIETTENTEIDIFS